MELGRCLFYDIATGSVIIDTGEWSDAVRKKTIDEHVSTYSALSERNRDSFDAIELEYGEYRQDFAEMTGVKVDVDTGTLLFSYPDPNEPETEPEFRPPLSIEVDELKQENMLLKAQNNALSERADFIEDVIAEMAVQVYQ
ncbi:hypothetical protein [Sporosarcina sp. FSL K6-2383]|uniref:hypothetical protein n=1 Tax=Sporosarcina sp. FSL K6-2383 TaxID=2921556 RepID=UPI00315AFE26